MIHSVWHWVEKISPWLIVSFIPSIITGLTPYPQYSGIIKFLNGAIEALSILTHSDSPSTFKPLLVPSAAPPVLGVEIPVEPAK